MKRSSLILLPLLFLLLAALPGQSTRAQSAAGAERAYAVREINHLPYYEDESMTTEKTRLNLVIPEGAENPPVLIWIGQGAWAYVDRNREMDICRQLAKDGVFVVSAGHRLSPALLGKEVREEGVQHPEHVKDIAQAFRWVYEHAEEYGYSRENIFVGGYSSGAHLAALLAMDNRYLKGIGLSNTMIAGIIPVGGGFDIPHYRNILIAEDSSYDRKHIHAVFGKTHEQHLDASPTTYIDSLITPILMISEGQTYQYSVVFEKMLSEKEGVDVQVINAHNETHGGLWKKLGTEENNIYRNFMVSYMMGRRK